MLSSAKETLYSATGNFYKRKKNVLAKTKNYSLLTNFPYCCKYLCWSGKFSSKLRQVEEIY